MVSAPPYISVHDAPHCLLASGTGDEIGGGLYAWDGARLEVIDRLSTTGLAEDGGRLFRVLQSGGRAGPGGTEVLVYDERGVERYVRIDAAEDTHGIEPAVDRLALVSTGDNSIVWIGNDGAIERTWRAPGSGDAWHLNCLARRDGDLYVSAFGPFREHRAWSSPARAGAGVLFNVTAGETAVSGLSCPHHPRFEDGAWLICDSMPGTLVAVDPDSSQVLASKELGGWTRGLAVADNVILVGVSSGRHSPERVAQTGRAFVVVLDRETWQELDRIELPSREVFDLVLVPPQLVEGARRGFDTNPLRAVEQHQHDLFRAAGVEPVLLWPTGEPLPPAGRRVRVRADLPERMAPAELVEVQASVGNHGAAVLASYPPNPVLLSYRWMDAATGDPVLAETGVPAEGIRTALPALLQPGHVATVAISVQAPATPGDYRLRLTAVQENVAWFDGDDPQSALDGLVAVG
jgi:hypothetical protein